MSDKQIQTTVRRDVVLTRQARPRGLVAQTSTVLIQPGLFFRTLAPASDTRQWLWIGLFILIMVGVAAVRYETLRDSSADPSAQAGDFGGDFGGVVTGGGGDLGAVPSDPFGGGIPGDVPLPGGGGETPASGLDTTTAWTTALLAASGIILGWLIQIILLCLVPMMSGYPPRLGYNLQVAVWASLPLALMAGLQLLFYAAGGNAGAPGLTGMADQLSWYSGASPLIQGVVNSFLAHMTLFWLWSFVLLYSGARNTLNGSRIASLLAIIAWILVLICVPPLINPPAASTSTEIIAPDGMIPDAGMFPEGASDLPPPGMFSEGNTERPVEAPIESEQGPSNNGGG